MKFNWNKIRKYGLIGLTLFLAPKIITIPVGYVGTKYFSDNHIKKFYTSAKIQQTINQNAYLPHTFFVSVPGTGNASKTIDLYLEKMALA